MAGVRLIMENLRELIRFEGKKLKELHTEIHRLLPGRNRSDGGLQKWSEACRRFHGYQSGIDEYLTEESFSRLKSGNPTMVEFALVFLEEDLRFFRSGYIKEKILEKLKKVPLDYKQTERLRAILLDAVEKRGGREFRRYCRLAKAVELSDFEDKLKTLISSDNDIVARRARMMLKYINKET